MPAGRPTELTPDVHTRIVELVRAGNFRQTALRAVGLSKNTIRNWELRGEGGEEPYVSFMLALQEAEALSETEMVADIRNAQPAVVGVQGADQWQARLAILERRFAHWNASRSAHKRDTEGEILAKLRAHPKLHEEVANVLAAEEDPAPGADVSH